MCLMLQNILNVICIFCAIRVPPLLPPHKVFNVSLFFIDAYIFIDSANDINIVLYDYCRLLHTTFITRGHPEAVYGFNHTTMCWLVFVPEAV